MFFNSEKEEEWFQDLKVSAKMRPCLDTIDK